MRFWTAAAAAVIAVVAASGMASAAPTPHPSPQATRIVIHLPKVPLHSEVVVEVNAKGQVVRIKSVKPSKLLSFNYQTYGNALQMWIRKCHTQGSTSSCTADVGLYRVTYDYDPKTTNVTRRVAIISHGGNWGNDPGAATVMMDMFRKQAAAAAEAERKAQEQNTKLPSLNEIRGQATPKPTHPPTLPP
ncbi:MAG: hypothetical protein JO146_03140 [Candidatus Eremiobacteraeota bacterium]|nr:hypothetical protein [Candidatus Eremiobacteraeota bacterium]